MGRTTYNKNNKNIKKFIDNNLIIEVIYDLVNKIKIYNKMIVYYDGYNNKSLASIFIYAHRKYFRLTIRDYILYIDDFCGINSISTDNRLTIAIADPDFEDKFIKILKSI